MRSSQNNHGSIVKGYALAFGTAQDVHARNWYRSKRVKRSHLSLHGVLGVCGHVAFVERDVVVGETYPARQHLTQATAAVDERDVVALRHTAMQEREDN
eukprot:515513-Prymnesium_polylepis.1